MTSLSRVLVVLLLVGVVVSCSDSGGDAKEDGDESSTAGERTTSTTSPAQAEEEVVEAWRTVWAGVTVEFDSGKSLTPEAEAAAREISEPAVIDAFPPVAKGREASLSPVPKVQADGSYVIEDCVILRPPPTFDPTLKFTGRAVNRDGRWVITELDHESLDPCVAKSMAQRAIEGYEAYWDARLEFWSPADPSHPKVAETLTGKQRAFIEGLLTEHQQRGVEFRGRPTTHPEVIEVRSPTELVLLDCQEQDPERGVYDAAGNRLNDVPPIDPGQRDVLSAVMILEDGKWKVEDIQGQTKVECQEAPTSDGFAVVG